MPTKTKRKPKTPRIQEWAFEADTSNGGKLTFRCLEFVVISENDQWTQGELDLWSEIVEVLNEFYAAPGPVK
jgi:hypothetical protein